MGTRNSIFVIYSPGWEGWKKIENLPTFSSLDAKYSKNPQNFVVDSFPGQINLIWNF